MLQHIHTAMEQPNAELDFLLNDARLRNAIQAREWASRSQAYNAPQHVHALPQRPSQPEDPQQRRRVATGKKRYVRHKHARHASKDGETYPSKQRKNIPPSLLTSAARFSRTNTNLITALDAGRLDPFDVYPQTNLPKYLQSLIDHTLNHVINAYLATDRRQEADQTRSLIIGEIMGNPLMWYPVMMSGITHYAYVHEQSQPGRSLSENHASKAHRLLRLSYKTQTISQIRAALDRENGDASDATLLAISTLMSHGAAGNDDLSFTQQADPVQMRKAFGTATDMHYYSSITFDMNHWHSIVRFVNKKRGGMHGIKWPLMQQSMQLIDTTVAWRRLEAPSMTLAIPTTVVISMAAHRPDEIANVQMRSLLSGLPLAWRTSPEQPYADLYQCLQHMRTLVVRYNQYQRRLTITQANLRPDLRLIIYTRGVALHDLLSLPILTTNGKGADGTYELIRHACLAFMQLVLFPITSVNETPRKILEQMAPLLELCCRVQAEHGGDEYVDAVTSAQLERQSVDVSGSLVLWAWMLAGMLAFEHLQTQQDSTWVDRLAPYVDEFAIRAEKSSWSMVKGVVETFLWLQSECDGPGQRWWNYACLWVDDKRRDAMRGR